MRSAIASLLVLAAFAGSAKATIHMLLDDEFDDRAIIHKAFDLPNVQAARESLHEFTRGLLRLKERDFIAVFGKPQAKPGKTYAMPVAEYRALGLSGIHYHDPAMNKNHTDFHIIPGIAGVEVWYQINGESPAAILVYLPVDKDFQKLTSENLEQRLAWDAKGLERLRDFTARRLEAVFPWVVDRDALAKHEADADAGRKIAAWIADGPALGYTYRHTEGSEDWQWYGPDGKLTRRAHRKGSPGFDPIAFDWTGPNGMPCHEEWFHQPVGQSITRRWTGPTGNIRYEGGGSWTWYGKTGRPIRIEWDDNGDGIPDWYITEADGPKHIADDEAKAKRKPLPVHASWAVHPELIPPESRVPDQEKFRLPVRRRQAVAGGLELHPEALVMNELKTDGPIDPDQSATIKAEGPASTRGTIVSLAGLALLLGVAFFSGYRRYGARTSEKV